MKIKYKFLSSILLFAIMFILFGIYVIVELNNVNHINHEIEESRKISVAALDFNVENFHTQLEMWEYAYEPNQERLDAFYSHQKTLGELLIKWADLVLEVSETNDEHFHALFIGAKSDMLTITSNLRSVEKDWTNILVSVKEYTDAKSQGVSDMELKRLDSIVLNNVIMNEFLFDELEFNKNVDKFVINQEELITNLELERKRITSSFVIALYVIIPVIVGISIVFSLVIARQITIPIQKLEDALQQFQEGKYENKLKPLGDVEIKNIINSFNIMVDTLNNQQEKLLRTEKLYTIGKLASRLAHDLRNPMAIIQGTVEMISYSLPEDKTMQSYVDKMYTAIARMTHQIENVLDYVKNKSLKIEKHFINSILNSVLDDSNIPTNITIEQQIQDYEIDCDSSMLKVVFVNLIMNAIQSIGDKQGKIIIRISEKNQDNISIQIEDTGPGIPNDVLSKIFEPLFTTKQEGTGLGLASCKSIIDQHNGTISINNNPTVFTIILPKQFTLKNNL